MAFSMIMNTSWTFVSSSIVLALLTHILAAAGHSEDRGGCSSSADPDSSVTLATVPAPQMHISISSLDNRAAAGPNSATF